MKTVSIDKNIFKKVLITEKTATEDVMVCVMDLKTMSCIFESTLLVSCFQKCHRVFLTSSSRFTGMSCCFIS